ncbi:MAG: ATP-binding protein [Candidatus Woesearchaeota archaeon]
MKLYKRTTYIDKIIPHINKNVVKILSGMRRTGKSVILKQIIDFIKEINQIPDKNIVSIDKELHGFSHILDEKALSDYIDTQFNGVKGKKYIFIDEVQLIQNWQISINSYLKSGDYDLYITGSNSDMLSSELSTLVSGRYINIEVFPLSFREFHDFSKDRFKNPSESFDCFIRYGGMPYLLCYSKEQLEDEIIYQYLRDLYSTIVLKDIVQRYSIRDSEELDRTILYMFDNIGNLTTAQNISKYLKSTGSSLTVTSVLNYISYLTETYLMHKCPRYDLTGKKLLTVNSKYYANDIGFINALLGYSFNRINRYLENLIYCDLIQKGYDVKVGFIHGNEVDFICEKRNNRIYIQVAYLLGSPDSDTYQREYKSLLSIKDNYPKYILSTDGKIAGEGEKGILRKNIQEFLLGDEGI